MIKIRFSFYGGAREVGKSSILAEHDKYSVMMDCGVKLGGETVKYPQQPPKLDTFILSHAHLDHSGAVPALYKKFKAPMYATDISFELSHLLQRDLVKINDMKGLGSPYTLPDIDAMKSLEKDSNYNTSYTLNDNISFKLYDAGHIPGSASILLETDTMKVLYTGDIKLSDTRLLKGCETTPKADVVITESTYGNRRHPPRKEMEKEFIDRVEETLARGGTALVPAFAVGRSQEMLMVLTELNYPIYLDGMGQDMTRLFLQYPKYLKDPDLLRKAASRSQWIKHRGDRKKAIREPAIIITTAGMLNGGPAVHYISKLYGDRKSSILLTGYQVEGTNGRLLQDEGYIIDNMNGNKIPIKMEVHYFDFSAHAGKDALGKIIRKANPKEIILVHGDPKACEELEELVKRIGETHIPKLGDTIEIR